MTTLLFAVMLLAGSPASWLRDAAAAEKEQAAKRAPYVYRERQLNWHLDAKGRKEEPAVTRVYEHVFLEGAPYKQLIERNGKPLSGAELTKREAARKKEAAVRREDRRLRKPFLPGSRNVRLGQLEELESAYTLKVSGEELVGEHPCVVIEAEPNGVTDTVRRKELQSYRQRLWIHRDLKILVKRRAEVIGPDSEILRGSTILFRWTPLAGEGGTWFAKRGEIDFGATLFRVKTERGLQIHEYFDYRRFQVESTITSDEPK